MEHQKYILIAANPKSGSAHRQTLISDLRDALLNDGYQVEICDSLAAVEQRAKATWSSNSLRAVVAAGGDGTAAMLANLLGPEIPLLIFPLGTENLLAKYLNIRSDVAEARNKLREAKMDSLDVGQANGRIFLVMASCGFDAEVVRGMHAIRKGHINRWSYAWPIWNAVRGYRFPQLSIQVADETGISRQVSTCSWLFAFNLPRYAAGLDFCPQADPRDGQLDLCSFKRPGIVRGMSYLARLWMRSHQRMSDFSHLLASKVTISAVDAQGNESHAQRERMKEAGQPLQTPIPYQLDGDPGGFLPLEITIQKRRLRLVV